MNCPNCQSTLSCGCQKRRASDGKDICTNCQVEYETKLDPSWTREYKPPVPQVQPTSPTAPTNVSVFYTKKEIDHKE